MSRLVFFIRFYPPFQGGAESQTARLAQALAEAGIDVLVVTGQGPGVDSRHPRLQVKRLDCNRIRAIGTLLYVWKALFLAWRFRPDAVIPVLPSDTVMVAWLVSLLTGAKRIYRLSGAGVTGEFSSLGKVQRRYHLYRRLLQSFHLICISQALRQEALAQGFTLAQMTCIPNGIPLGEAPSEPLAESKVFMGIGRLSPEKGFDVAIAAFAQSGLAVLGWRLRLGGEGPALAALQLQAEQLGVAVEFAGPITDVPQALAQTTVFVLPSHSEGMSNAMLEAMAAARPIIATDVSGVRDVLEDQRSALIIPVADAEAMAMAMRRMAQDPKLRADLAQAALASVREHCAMELVIKRWVALVGVSHG